jgi:hypothetical protein
MIILPDISENNKCIFIHSRPIFSVSVLSEIQKQKRTLDDIFIMYIPLEHLIEKFYYENGISNVEPNDPHRPGGPVASQTMRFENFMEICDDFKIEQKNIMIFKEMSDFDFKNGDNFIKDIFRMDLYVDFIRLVLEKDEYDISEVAFVMDSFHSDSYEHEKKSYNISVRGYESFYDSYNNEKVYRPFKNLSRKEMLEVGILNNPILFNKWDYKEREDFKKLFGENEVKDDWSTRPEPYKP